MKQKLTTLLLVFAVAITSFAQAKSNTKTSIQQYEDSLCKFLVKYAPADKSITSWPRKTFDDFTLYLKNNPSTMTYSFDKMRDKYLYIHESEDGLVRVYRAKIQTKDPKFPVFISLTQYKGKSGVQLYAGNTSWYGDGKSWGEQYSCCTQLMTVPVKGSNVYLAEHSISSESQECACNITALTIDGDKIKPTKVFADSKGARSANVPYSCKGIADWWNRSDGTGWNKTLTYDKASKEVRIIKCNEAGAFDESHYVYKIDGDHLSLVRTDCGIDLCPSLKPIKSLMQLIVGSKHTYRIDRVSPTKVRYTSWAKGKSTLSEPDIKIEKDVPADYKLQKFISFANGGYTYIVNTEKLIVEVKKSSGEVVSRDQSVRLK